MKKIAAILLATGLLFASVPAISGDADAARSTRIRWKRNRVQATRGGRWVNAYNNMPIRTGSYVRTGSRSRAQINYGDGSIVRLGSRSIARIRGTRRKRVRLRRGKAYFRVKRQRRRMRVRTRTAVATVLGTEFIVSVDEPKKTAFNPNNPNSTAMGMDYAQAGGIGNTNITVLNGAVGVQGMNGGPQINLGAGMTSNIGFNKNPSPPKPGNTQGLVNSSGLGESSSFSQEPLEPSNPNQKVQVNQNSPNENLNTSPTTGTLEIIIK